ncbi:MAG TPA: lipid-A-disaccharide synthase [Candidatus Rifleibacterium sp.]|nr:lipid-A-disaccharide synthase [Candidatus Rifleibacterium sp.]
MKSVVKARKKLLIVAGETSGDFYAASLIDVLKKSGDYEIFAVGGIQTRQRDVNMLCDSTNWAAIGLFEAIKQAPHLFLVLYRLRRFLVEQRPDLVLLVDYPGFNMRLVHAAHKLGIPTLYYFPPSKFATDPASVTDAAGSITRVAANFASTYEVYKAAGANVEFVGHPLLDHAKPVMTIEETCQKYGIKADRPVIGLCPGSRRSELGQLLPVMLAAGKLIHQRYPECQFVVPVIATEGPEVFGVQKTALREQLAASGIPVTLAEGKIYDVMKLARLLLICSGTATLEATYVGTPMVICYKVSVFTEIQARLFYQLPKFIGLPNIIIGRMAIPELIQHDLTPENLAEKAFELLDSPEKYQQQKNDFAEVIAHLGEPGAHERVAAMVESLLQSTNIGN